MQLDTGSVIVFFRVYHKLIGCILIVVNTFININNQGLQIANQTKINWIITYKSNKCFDIIVLKLNLFKIGCSNHIILIILR